MCLWHDSELIYSWKSPVRLIDYCQRVINTQMVKMWNYIWDTTIWNKAAVAPSFKHQRGDIFLLTILFSYKKNKTRKRWLEMCDFGGKAHCDSQNQWCPHFRSSLVVRAVDVWDAVQGKMLTNGNGRARPPLTLSRRDEKVYKWRIKKWKKNKIREAWQQPPRAPDLIEFLARLEGFPQKGCSHFLTKDLCSA